MNRTYAAAFIVLTLSYLAAPASEVTMVLHKYEPFVDSRMREVIAYQTPSSAGQLPLAYDGCEFNMSAKLSEKDQIEAEKSCLEKILTANLASTGAVAAIIGTQVKLPNWWATLNHQYAIQLRTADDKVYITGIHIGCDFVTDPDSKTSLAKMQCLTDGVDIELKDAKSGLVALYLGVSKEYCNGRRGCP